MAENLWIAHCSPSVFSKVLAARKKNLITVRAHRNKRSGRMLANASKDHWISLVNRHMFPEWKSAKFVSNLMAKQQGTSHPKSIATEVNYQLPLINRGWFWLLTKSHNYEADNHSWSNRWYWSHCWDIWVNPRFARLSWQLWFWSDVISQCQKQK